MDKRVWSGLDHKIWRGRSSWPRFKRVLVALSGGVDSVALLSVFHRLTKASFFEILAVNIHHGPGAQESWRSETQEMCRSICENWGIKMIESKPSVKELKSEEDLRDFRYEELRKLKDEFQCDFILTAHHADDLLETRFLRIMRGTGPLGLEALREFDEDLWRPFLEVTKEEILHYASENQLKFVEDPSNQSVDPMRNWLRHELFPMMESRQTGVLQNMSRSFQLLVEFLDSEVDNIDLIDSRHKGVEFERDLYLSLSDQDQRKILVKSLLRLQLRNYSHGQILEIQKRLDNSQNIHNFMLASTSWSVDAKRIHVSRVDKL